MISSATLAKAGAISPCICMGSGMALYGSLNLPLGALAINVVGDQCGAAVSLGFPAVTASAVCSNFDTAVCTASSSVANLSIYGLVSATLLESTATAPTDPANCLFPGEANIVNLNVLGTLITATGEPNQVETVDALGLHATVILNSQMCQDSQLTVAAVKITITGPGTDVLLTVAESRASCNCCPCPNTGPGEPTTTTTPNPSTTTTAPGGGETPSTTIGGGQDPGASVSGNQLVAPPPVATPVKPGDVTFTG